MIPLSRPSIGDAEIDAVARVLRSGWLATGRVVQEFEEAVAELSECRYAVACMSGTDALFLSLRAAGFGPGDTVIVPSMTFCATVNAVVRVGATPVFADIDESTLCLDLQDVREKVRAVVGGRCGVIPVHFGGAPCDVGDVLIGFGDDIFLLADGAHALGARVGRYPVTVVADATVFSFHPTKNITTGEGGMIVTDDEALANRARLLGFHGLDERKLVREPGIKSNMPDVLAAIGLAQLERLEEMNGSRRRLAAQYTARLAGVDSVTVPAGPSFEHVHARHLMSVLVNFDWLGVTRERVIRSMAARGVEVGVHYEAVHMHPYYMGYHRTRLPVTELVSNRILSLPLYPDMAASDVDTVVGVLAAVLHG